MASNEKETSASYTMLVNFYHGNKLLVRGQIAPEFNAKDAAQYLRDKLIKPIK
jgi:hypothetical protein